MIAFLEMDFFRLPHLHREHPESFPASIEPLEFYNIPNLYILEKVKTGIPVTSQDTMTIAAR